jgi:hypothetical protein
MEQRARTSTDRLVEMAANLKTTAAVMGESVHTAAQKAVQDRLLSSQMAEPYRVAVLDQR